MDAKTIAKILQIVVKEEVSKIVRKEMRMLKTQLISEMKKSQSPKELSSVIPDINFDEIRNPNKTQTKKLSNNSVLNEVLNETQAFNSNQEDYPTMGKTFNSNDARVGINKYRQMMESENMSSIPNAIPELDVNNKPVNPDVIPDKLKKALTRDYSDLVKAMKK